MFVEHGCEPADLSIDDVVIKIANHWFAHINLAFQHWGHRDILHPNIFVYVQNIREWNRLQRPFGLQEATIAKIPRCTRAEM